MIGLNRISLYKNFNKESRTLGKKKFWILIVLMLLVLYVAGNKIVSLLQTSKLDLEVSEDYEEIIEEYLLNNYSTINPKNDEDFEDLSILDSDLEGKEIFFTGELHGVEANAGLRMKFLKYFKEKTDFKYYLCELGYSHAYFLNKYLDTGDTKILEELYKPLKGTFEWNKSNYSHWKMLYEYNKTLPEDKRIQVVGVDIEHQIDVAYKYLADVLPEVEAPIEIKDKIDGIKAILDIDNRFNDGVAVDFSRELLKDIADKESIYKEYLGDNFKGFKFVNQNILNTVAAYENNNNDYDWNNTRDKFIYENFLAIQEELPKGKYYGQWGLNHAFQSEEDGVMWFGAYLNREGSAFKDKILTIAYFYDNCMQMNRTNTRAYISIKLNFIPEIFKKVNDLTGSNINIYRLNSKDSPFYELNMNSTLSGKELEAKITDFFQYVVCIKGSKATEPLNDEYN